MEAKISESWRPRQAKHEGLHRKIMARLSFIDLTSELRTLHIHILYPLFFYRSLNNKTFSGSLNKTFPASLNKTFPASLNKTFSESLNNTIRIF